MLSYTERMELFFDSLKNRFYFNGVLLKSASSSYGVGDAKFMVPVGELLGKPMVYSLVSLKNHIHAYLWRVRRDYIVMRLE